MIRADETGSASPRGEQLTRVRRFSERASIVMLIIAESLGFVAQTALIYFGLIYINDDTMSDAADLRTLLAWCAIGTLYLLGTALWLSLDLRLRESDPPIMRKFVGGRLGRWVSLFATFSASIVGVTATVDLIVVRGDPDHNPISELMAVWAMLVSWALFHWGYARIYHADFSRAKGADPLVFPGTEQPRLTDFAFLAFSIATSFGSNGVLAHTSRMRWKIVWHSVFSFFFNALIIVLTMNTIVGGL